MRDNLAMSENKGNKILAIGENCCTMFTEVMRYSITDRQVTPRRQKSIEYDALALKVKKLPTGKAIRFAVPDGQLANRVRTKLYNVLKSRSVDVSITALSESELEISLAT